MARQDHRLPPRTPRARVLARSRQPRRERGIGPRRRERYVQHPQLHLGYDPGQREVQLTPLSRARVPECRLRQQRV